MTTPISKLPWKAAPPTPDPSGGQDRALARTPLWRRLLLPAGAAIIVIALASWALLQSGGSVYRAPLDQLTIGTVTQGPFEDFIAVRGAVAPFTTAYLTTDQGGTVKQVLVEDGALVKSGQAIILLSNPALQLQVASQQLAFEQTRLKYEQDLLDVGHQISKLQGDLARDKILLDGGALAPSIYTAEQEELVYNLKLRDTLTASRKVEEQVRATQLSSQTGHADAGGVANAGVEALTIRAPMDGQLTALDAEVGQSKASGAVLGQVNSADRFKLTAQVDEFYLGRVILGQEALFTVGDHDYKAHVAKIYPQVTDGTFKVDLYFTGASPSDVHVGQAIDLKVELGNPAPAIMLPNGPFYQDTGGNWVFVLSPDGSFATKRTVRLGRKNPQFVEVVDGLKPGEKVIVSGYEAFEKMDRVTFTKTSENQ